MWLLLGLVLINVALQLLSAVLVKYSAEFALASVPWLGLMSLILVLNFSRFIVWNAMHKRFPVSLAYPATALFFPCLAVMAYFLGEPVTAPQVAGVSLVTVGVLVLLATGEDVEA